MDPSITSELGGIAVLALLVLALVRPCLEVERLIARRHAGIPSGTPVAYRRTRDGVLRAIVHPSARATA